ncbi:MAG: GNAT family N-acetyltransferase [Planctomycetota bacterium]|nr:GNAT family N-acetyltransferase [Planctomycetota bacterium]
MVEPQPPRPSVRAARRSDLQVLTDLRMRFLGEAAHDEPRLRLMPDARVRTEQAFPVWMGHDDRVILLAAPSEGEDEATPVAYAMGLLRRAPPILASQNVGEILEVYVTPEHRGEGLAAKLVAVLTDALVGRGAEVLRSAVPVGHVAATARLERAGYRPLQIELERSLGAG